MRRMKVPKNMLVLGALLLGALAPAQQQTTQPPAAQEPTAKQAFDQLAKDFATAQQEFQAKARKEAAAAKAEGRQAPAMRMTAVAEEWRPKFQAGADQYKGTDGAVPFLVWLGNNSSGAERDKVLATLLGDHIRSAAFGSALRLITSQMQVGAPRLMNMQTGKAADDGDAAARAAAVAEAEKRVRSMLAQVIEQNPVPDVQAQALLARANLVLQSRDKEKVTDEARKSAIADVRAGFARAVDKEIKTQCEGILFEEDHLAIGMTAPEVEGHDLDGVPFKLSDYRGKVVLLDFWGYW